MCLDSRDSRAGDPLFRHSRSDAHAGDSKRVVTRTRQTWLATLCVLASGCAAGVGDRALEPAGRRGAGDYLDQTDGLVVVTTERLHDFTVRFWCQLAHGQQAAAGCSWEATFWPDGEGTAFGGSRGLGEDAAQPSFTKWDRASALDHVNQAVRRIFFSRGLSEEHFIFAETQVRLAELYQTETLVSALKAAADSEDAEAEAPSLPDEREVYWDAVRDLVTAAASAEDNAACALSAMLGVLPLLEGFPYWLAGPIDPSRPEPAVLPEASPPEGDSWIAPGVALQATLDNLPSDLRGTPEQALIGLLDGSACKLLEFRSGITIDRLPIGAPEGPAQEWPVPPLHVPLHDLT